MYHGVGLGTSGLFTGVAILKVLPKSHGFHFMMIVAAISLIFGLVVFTNSAIVFYRKKIKND